MTKEKIHTQIGCKKRLHVALNGLGLIFGVSTFSLLQSAPSTAQDTVSSSGRAEVTAPQGLEEIVVTAQRRAESLQSVALSIAAYSGEDLLKRGVTEAMDLSRIDPALQISGASFNQIYIRGVGDFGVTAEANPAVASSVNGVPISRSNAISGNFFDLERVEVLKGPQGTLYGRNASGGAINLIANKPVLGELSGYLTGSFGNYDTLLTEGAINMPAGDNAALRISGQVSDRDGYLSDGQDDAEHVSVRLQGLFESGPLTAHLRSSYVHVGGRGTGYAVMPKIPGESAWVGAGSKVAADHYIGLAAANFEASGGTSIPPFLLDRPDTYPLFNDLDSWAIDAQFDYEFDGATLTVIPAYRKTRIEFALPISYNYSPGGGGTDGDESDYYSLELRLGNEGEKLKWVIGAFAFDEAQSTDFLVDTGLVQRFRIAADLDSTAYAAFGEGTYSLTDNFRITAGIRYTSDERETTNFENAAISPTVIGNPIPCLPETGFPVGTQCSLLPPISFDSKKTFNKVTWRAGVEYDLGESNMVFANVATGFKAGGFSQAIDPANPVEQLSFDPETITAYTIGSRNRFLDNRLQLNLEGFYWDYEDLQLTQVIVDGVGNLALTTQNAGEARIFGLNVNASAKVASGTTLHAGIEYVDSEYKDFRFVQASAVTPPESTGCALTPSSLAPGPLGPFVEVNCSGFRLLRSPEWTSTVGISQVFEISNGSNITLDGDIAFASKRFVSASFVPLSLDDAYANLSAALTYYAPEEKWFIGAYIRNITDEEIYMGGGAVSPFVPQYLTSSIAPPRTYGVRLGANF
tara:strand:+ start:16993 stop:19410 length:2418 start_codon:yes stop_codon:yes gene_type:complete